MEFNYSNKSIKWVRYGLIWNAVALVLTAIARARAVGLAGGSFGQIAGAFGFVIIVSGVVLFFNVYAFKLVLKLKNIQAINMGIAMAVAGLLSLNIIGSLAVLLSYLRLRRDLKNELEIETSIREE